ncbi:hypothetical protein [Vibrio sp. 10N.261.55.A7]|uniref:tetratricopeptide repeat protein n=1 Tax=Vibrio sp. 10N.261.55.A7 TaxID=1880851 RepID=UPI000CAFC424|nr:hypothetical protein [Vibrio sp. 10N.261.55.A7]PMJ91338.1 hypothetical protein BCU12_10485 [Vibrio sp. 10N.261.55.A7]
MSHINQALSELSQKGQGAKVKIEKAQIEKVKSRPAIVWLIGGFSLSLAIGGWTVSQQSVVVGQPMLAKPLVISEVEVSHQNPFGNNDVAVSTTEQEAKRATADNSRQQVTIYQSPSSENTTSSVKSEAVSPPKTRIEKNSSAVTADSKVTPVKPKVVVSAHSLQTPSSTILLANNSSSKANLTSTSKPSNNSVTIEQVELTPKQLAKKAEQQARKAIDNNNIDEALNSYRDALRYDPTDEIVRQQLSALYYGKGDPRKAFEVLQEGVNRDNGSEVLRIALAKLLIKEQQPEAALTPLMYLSHTPTVEYLSLRAALAQKNGLDDIALETYQQLVIVDGANARWWLGLAIQQERNADMSSAAEAYQKALTKVGLSRQSQIFVRERLKLLSTIDMNKTSTGSTASKENDLAN